MTGVLATVAAIRALKEEQGRILLRGIRATHYRMSGLWKISNTNRSRLAAFLQSKSPDQERRHLRSRDVISRAIQCVIRRASQCYSYHRHSNTLTVTSTH